MGEGNGSAVREAILEFVQETTGNPGEAPGDKVPVTSHIDDVFDACELSMKLEERFPRSKGHIMQAMEMMGLNAEQTDYNPETATIRTYEDLYAALDGVE